jgi:hypothetical protein
MKRYDLVWSIDGDKIDRIDEKTDGDYVLYDDIKDDRALLEDMVKIIETYMKRAKRNEPVSLRSEKEFVSFLARAKERGIG